MTKITNITCRDFLSGERFELPLSAGATDADVESAIEQYISDGLDEDEEVAYQVETSDGRHFDGVVSAK